MEHGVVAHGSVFGMPTQTALPGGIPERDKPQNDIAVQIAESGVVIEHRVSTLAATGIDS